MPPASQIGQAVSSRNLLATYNLIRTPAYQQLDHAARVPDTWEPARIARAERLGVGYVAPDVYSGSTSDGGGETHNPLNSALDQAGVVCSRGDCINATSIPQVWVDCELGRVAICRHELPEFRVWLYAHKESGGSGRILKSELYKYLAGSLMLTSRSTFAGIIARGNRLYWRERGGYLYLTSWRKLASKLTRWEAKYHPDHVATNRPGQRRVQLDLTGSLKLAHALIYNGWIAVKSERNGYLDISRWTLEKLWGRNRRQLRSWEKLVGIRIESRYAESGDIHSTAIPAHANLCLDRGGVEFSSWQLSNRIYPADTTISITKGQSRKVRAAANQTYNSIEPADLKHGGLLRVQRTGRLYFTGRDGKNGYVSPYKQIDKHLTKHGDIFQRQHYAYLTTRYGKHIYEYTFDGTQSRSALCERDRLAEQGVEFRLRRMQYRIGWSVRMGV